MGTSRRDRRIFQRVENPGLALEFDVREATGPFRSRRSSAYAAEVVDVSVSGAQIMVSSRERPRPGSMVRIRHDGAVGTVLIRWEAAGSAAHTWLYGVEFLELDADLREHLGRPIDERRGQLRHYQFTSPIARASKFT